jgi:hypothetical protein
MLVILVALAASRSSASADELGTQAAMEDYFAGEKSGGLALIGMGAVGLGTGAFLVTRDSDVARGAGYATLTVGTLHAAAGLFVYIASARRISTFTGEIEADESAFRVREARRVTGVGKQFLALEIVEGVLIAGGTGAAIYGLSTDRDVLAGVAIGVAAESAATLVFDIIAARRAKRYRSALRAPSVVIEPDSRHGGLRVSLGMSGSF